MVTDVEQVARMLIDAGVDPMVTIARHEVTWEQRGIRWTYFGSLYGGRETRLTAYRVTSQQDVAVAAGEVVK